jgi:Dna[CI] antecedent, DciA
VKWLPDLIAAEVRRELARFGPAGALGEIVAAWPAAVGPGIAANAWPARVARDGTLHVATSSSAWAFELTQLSSSVLARLGEHLTDEACPTGLRFAVGPLPEAGGEGERNEKRIVPKPSEGEKAEAAELVLEIADEGLREAVAKAVAMSLAASSAQR